MEIIAIVFGVLMLILIVYLSYKVGQYREAHKIARTYVKDVDEYINKINAIDNYRADTFSNDDILSGKVLSKDSPPLETNT